MYNIYLISIDNNSSQSFTVNVKPLGSNQSIRLKSIKYLHTLNLKGEFTKQDMIIRLVNLAELRIFFHKFQLQNLQEVITQTHLFINSALYIYLQIKFNQISALFKSYSIFTIYTCRQSNLLCIKQTKEQYKQKCKNQNFVQYLQKIKTLQDAYVIIKKQYKNKEILPAIKELLIYNDFSIISKDFQQIYSSEQELSEIYKELLNKIQYLEDLLIDTYTSKCNLKSQFDINIDNVKSLWKRDFSELIYIFQNELKMNQKQIYLFQETFFILNLYSIGLCYHIGNQLKKYITLQIKINFMIIKNQILIDKVIDIFRFDQEDNRPLQLFLQKLDILSQHIGLLMPNIKLIYFDQVGQSFDCEKQVYLFLKGKLSVDSILILESFQILKPTIMRIVYHYQVTFSRILYNQIVQMNRQKEIEAKLTYLIQFSFFSCIYLSSIYAILDQIPLKTYQYKTNLSIILPGIVCIIKQGSVVLQSVKGPIHKQFSIITEKDLFGEAHFIDEDNKINLKQFQFNQNYYEAICNSQEVELYLINVSEIIHSLNSQQLKLYLQKKFKQRISQLNQNIEQNQSFSKPLQQQQQQLSQKRLRTKTIGSDSQYENLKQKESAAIDKVKEVVRNMNFSYSRTRNYFASKLGAQNILFHKAFMYQYTPYNIKKQRQSSLSSAIKQKLSQRTERCKTMSNIEIRTIFLQNCFQKGHQEQKEKQSKQNIFD
ncbi:unnamed protein product [Paramecium sonneborni]|uniref:BBS7 helical hairpin domain-containing protein n=1 Tax=Paramecium sonneborni TaxID=65129 RepID=A0A8S1PT79_9CILI|nr:unnamed protein product [Paramecium sonneborni]